MALGIFLFCAMESAELYERILCRAWNCKLGKDPNAMADRAIYKRLESGLKQLENRGVSQEIREETQHLFSEVKKAVENAIREVISKILNNPAQKAETETLTMLADSILGVSSQGLLEDIMDECEFIFSYVGMHLK